MILKRSTNKNRLGTLKAGFALLLCAIVFAGSVYWISKAKLKTGKPPRIQSTPVMDDPGKNAVFVFASQTELSHLYLYYDIGPSIENARKADILVVGNSRSQLGIREPLFDAAKELGLRAFNLGVGHADGSSFALDLIKRHNLRPKVIIVNGGSSIFYGGYSKWARKAMSMGEWNARKKIWEGTVGWWVKSKLHSFIPRVEYFKGRLTSHWVHYRSTDNGWWRNVLEPRRGYPISFVDKKPSDPRSVPRATEFVEEMKARGSVVVLTTAPYRKANLNHLEHLSELLKISYVLPPLEGLKTADSSHLNFESAQRFTSDLWDRLIALPEVKEALDLIEK